MFSSSYILSYYNQFYCSIYLTLILSILNRQNIRILSGNVFGNPPFQANAHHLDLARLALVSWNVTPGLKD